MSRRVFLSVFEDEEALLKAVRAFREKGYAIVDVYTPYAIHGLDQAMGLRPTRLPWVCFLIGLLAAAAKVWFEYWTTAVSWPINVGGKPWDSLPAFVPVTFEVMVLGAGLGTVLAFFFSRNLWPGKSAVMPSSKITDHQFVLILEESNAVFEVDHVTKLCRAFHAVHIEERLEGAQG